VVLPRGPFNFGLGCKGHLLIFTQGLRRYPTARNRPAKIPPRTEHRCGKTIWRLWKCFPPSKGKGRGEDTFPSFLAAYSGFREAVTNPAGIIPRLFPEMPGPCRYPVISNPAPSKLPPIWLYLLWSWKPPSNNHPFGLSKYQHMAAETRHISPTEYKRVKQRAKVGGEFRYSPLEISQSSPDSKKLPRPKHSAAITQLSVFSPSGWGTGKHRSSELETVFNYPDYAGLNLVAVVSEVS